MNLGCYRGSVQKMSVLCFASAAHTKLEQANSQHVTGQGFQTSNSQISSSHTAEELCICHGQWKHSNNVCQTLACREKFVLP